MRISDPTRTTISTIADGDHEYVAVDGDGNGSSQNKTQKMTFDKFALAVANVNSNANDDTATLTNKNIDSDDNTITNIVDADIKSTAGIDARKLGNGDVTNTELSYINSLTTNVQTRLNSLTTILDNIGTPPRFVTIEKTTDTGKKFTITEAEIQTAGGLTNSLLYSVNFYSMIIQTKMETGTPVCRLETPTVMQITGQIDNSVTHLDDIEFTMGSATQKYFVSIMFTTLDASPVGT